MTLTFPSNPTNGQQFVAENGKLYVWDGKRWVATETVDYASTNYVHSAQVIEVVNYNQSLTTGDLTGYGALGDVTVARVSPRWRGYEGQYWSAATRSANAGIFASSLETATDVNPYDYGTYNKGPRSSRGGLLDGWGGVNGGIFKINKPANGSDSWANGVYIYAKPSLTHMKANSYRFRAYMWVDYGSLNFGMSYLDDNQSAFTVPSLKQWHYIEVTIGGSDIMDPRKLLNIKSNGGEARQIFMAFPTVEAVFGHGRTNQDNAQFVSITG